MSPALFIEILLSVLALMVLVPALILFVQVLAALPPYRPRVLAKGLRPSIAVLIPAHNEAAGITGTLDSISRQLEPGDRLIVIADNCDDDTAAIASRAGAEVLQRSDRARRGKGYALDYGVRHLASGPRDAVLIVDADCRVDSGSVEHLARLCFETRRPVQALDLMLSPVGAGLTTRVAEFAWRVKNHVRPLGLKRLGLPCQLMGTGMAIPWPVAASARFASESIVEDLELGIALACSGTPPLFCPEARVTSYFPKANETRSAQRARWEHGHLGMIINAAPRLFFEGFRHRDRNRIALALDLIVPPVALLALAVMAVFVVAAGFSSAATSLLPLVLATLALLMLGLAVLLSWIRHGRSVLSFKDLAYAPLYALRKAPLYVRFLVKRQVNWVQSKRDER